MPAIDFPNSPTVDDVHTVGGRSWKWDGSTWSRFGGPVGPTGPTGPTGAASTVTGPTGATGPAVASLTGGTVTGSLVDQLEENWNIVATAVPSSFNFDIKTASIWYYTGGSTVDWTPNFRGNSTTTLSSLLSVGNSITCMLAVNHLSQGLTVYKSTSITIDGVAATVRWQGSLTPTGNISSIDLYSYTIIKTAATPTYLVIGSMTQFK